MRWSLVTCALGDVAGSGAGGHVGGQDVYFGCRPGFLRPTWTSRRSTPASSMVVTKVWPSMCGCGPGDPHPGGFGEVPQAAGGGVAVHPGAAAVEQDRAAGTMTQVR